MFELRQKHVQITCMIKAGNVALMGKDVCEGERMCMFPVVGTWRVPVGSRREAAVWPPGDITFCGLQEALSGGSPLNFLLKPRELGQEF